MARPGHDAHTPDENHRVRFQLVTSAQEHQENDFGNAEPDEEQSAKGNDDEDSEEFGHKLHRVQSYGTESPRGHSTPRWRPPVPPVFQDDDKMRSTRARVSAADHATDELTGAMLSEHEIRPLPNAELPEEIVSFETYAYIGFTAIKAASLFESWQYRRSVSDTDAGLQQALSVNFFQHAMQHGVAAYGGVDEYQTISHGDQAVWRLCLTSLGINEEVQSIVLSDPYADDRATSHGIFDRRRPRRNAISWVRQVMHSRWQWLHIFKRVQFPGPLFLENLDGALEQWYCRLKLSAQVPKNIRSLKTLQFLGFKVRRAADIFADIYGDSDVLTETENQLYLYEVIQEWIQSHERIDVSAEGDWRPIFEEVGMNNQLCNAVRDPLFITLRKAEALPSALACLRDVVAARWRCLFRFSEHPYPGPDDDAEDMASMPLARFRWS